MASEGRRRGGNQRDWASEIYVKEWRSAVGRIEGTDPKGGKRVAVEASAKTRGGSVMIWYTTSSWPPH
eukprot:scaffold16484_cov33-Tisochrysis_lutea.AAC.1